MVAYFEAFEASLTKRGFFRIAGIDEAGRGPLAGPVVAAACILPQQIPVPGLDDSKKLSEKTRNKIFESMVAKVPHGFGIVDAKLIDEINILQATFLAMQKAVSELEADYYLIDGNRCFESDIPAEAIVKGDARCRSIALASVFAKVKRDRIMAEYDTLYPEYGFEAHKGYGTRRHKEALEELGPCPIHRLSFAPVVKVTEGTSNQTKALSFEGADF